MSGTVRQKITRLIQDPFGVLKRRWVTLSERGRFMTPHDYRSAEYWSYRHGKFGFDLRGVGDKTKTHEENLRLLEQGSRVFLQVCEEAHVMFEKSRVLDVGCGTGHFAEAVRGSGVTDYLGIDIVDTLFAGLASRFPGFRFQQLDVATEPLSGMYDLILAMDVLQHIVREDKFRFALENIRSHLAPSGTVIISTHLGPLRRESFYVMRRPFEFFKEAFAGFELGTPSPYADSFVFSLRRKQ